ncbi:MAG: hypothetical protein LC104_19310 [Bacteroidales bacterium]|nr:hypothetical protein [Bacteroidales bacterium]
MYPSLTHVPSGKRNHPQDEREQKRNPSRWRWILGMLLVAGLVSTGAYFASSHAGDLAKVEKMREELFTAEARKLSEEDRRAQFEQFRKEMEKLDVHQRASFFDSGIARTREKYDSYFKLSPAEKIKHLDAEIARGEQARQAWEARRTAAGNASAHGAQAANAGSGASGNRSATGDRPNGERGPNRSPAEMEQRRKQFLDRTTPKQRATMDQMRELSSKYRDDMNKRRKQLGLPEMTGRGPGGPGFGGPGFGGPGGPR